ncbi:MAG TPA: hypothetical protein VIK59_03475 [Verrucomicrobiae bacterium]
MSESQSTDFNSYLRRCLYVFIAAVCMITLMIVVSFLPNVGWSVKVPVILAIAGVNAFVVAGFLMHLLSEKKMVYTVLGLTVVLVIALAALTVYAMHDFPAGTTMH